MLFKNILVPYDLSSPSNKAFKVALDLAQKYDSKITLITCVERDAWHHKFYDARADAQLLKEQTKVAKKNMEKLEETANKVGITIKLQVIKSNSVAKDITTFAKSRKIDLIVMSSHSRTGIDKIILGSVANGVVQRTSVPVLLIKWDEVQLISIIGSGLVGSSIAFLCAVNSIDDIVLLNRTKSKALGEALDISNAIPKNSDYTIKGTDDYSEISNSDVIIVAASTGVYLKNRNEMIDPQAVMIKQIGKKIKENCKSPITLIVSNPVDVLTYFFQKETKFPREKVIGIASSLDSSRFRFLLSKYLNVKKSQISDAIVMGEHGDSMVPIFSKVKINEKSALEMIESDMKDKISIEIRDYWKALRNFKSRSQFGIAKNTFDVIKSIIQNQEISIPASVLLEGEYDESEVSMGVPISITKDGVSKIQEIDLDKHESELLKSSANKIRNNINSV